MVKAKKISKDYIKGFKHGVKWALTMAKCELTKFDKTGNIDQGESTSLEISLNNILVSSKEAVKSLKEGR